MAYSSTNPVRTMVDFGFGSSGGQQFLIYESSHGSTEIEAADFFTGCGFGSPNTNGAGMRVGDILMHVNTQTNGVSFHRVTAVTTKSDWFTELHATVGSGST